VTLPPLFPLALGGFYPLRSYGTRGTILAPVGLRHIDTATEDAFLLVCLTGFHTPGFFPLEQGGAQVGIQRQDGGAEPLTDQ